MALLNLNPLISFLFLSLSGKLKETTVARVSKASTVLQCVLAISLLVFWFRDGASPHEGLLFELNPHGNFNFPFFYLIDLYSIAGVSTITAIFLFVTHYSRYYMHRDPGYQRYFAILHLFLSGLTILMIAGNLELLFAGWDFLGISSFLLIGFYHHRLSAVRNSLIIFAIYRFSDLGLILDSWLKEYLFPEAHRFIMLQDVASSGALETIHPNLFLLVSFLFILSAVGKSAQFPFSFWLARAMEGPTSSSAIFYGALSLHAGTFLLIRTLPFWFFAPPARYAIFGIGLLTVILAGITSQSQSNIKGRLAYAACFHVGLQFIELSLGFPKIALIHMVGHMFVRCYQFLISPAVVTYGLRAQNFATAQKIHTRDKLFFALPKKLQKSLYVFSLNEGYLEQILDRLFIFPFEWISACFSRFSSVLFFISLVFTQLVLAEAITHYSGYYSIYLEWLGAILMLLTCLSASGETRSIFNMWNSIGLSNFMLGLFILFATKGKFETSSLYFLSMFGFWLLGFAVLRYLFKNISENHFSKYWAQSAVSPKASHLMLIAFLGISGFPLFPSFLAEDMVLDHLIGVQCPFVIVGVFVLMVNGISAARLYTRVCWGPTDTI